MSKTTKALLVLATGAVLASCAHKPLTSPCKPAKYSSVDAECDPKPINYAALPASNIATDG